MLGPGFPLNYYLWMLAIAGVVPFHHIIVVFWVSSHIHSTPAPAHSLNSKNVFRSLYGYGSNGAYMNGKSKAQTTKPNYSQELAQVHWSIGVQFLSPIRWVGSRHNILEKITFLILFYGNLSCKNWNLSYNTKLVTSIHWIGDVGQEYWSRTEHT